MSLPQGMPLLPQWQMVLKPDTLRGVQSYRTGLVLDIVFGTFALLISVTGVLLGTASDMGGALAAAAILGASSCGLLIVFVINFIVSLISVMRMHHGAEEYGEDHARYARRGVLFKWAGTTLSTLAAILVAYIAISGSSLFFAPSGTVPPHIFIPLLVTGFWTAGVACKAQMYRNLVRALQPPATLRASQIASLLIPILGLVGVGIVGFTTARLIASITDPGSVGVVEAANISTIMLSGVFLPPGLAVAGYVIFSWVYAQTYRRLTEALRATAPSVPYAYPWMPYAMPPVAYPYAAPPPVTSGPMRSPAAPPPFPARCPRCSSANAPTAAFCSACGLKLGP